MPHIWKILHHIMGSLFQLKYVIVGNRAATLPLPLPAVPQALPPSRQIRARTVLFFQQRSKHTVLVNRIFFFSCTELHRAHSASTAQCSVLAASFESPWSMSARSQSHQLQLCAAAVDGGNWFTRLETCHVHCCNSRRPPAPTHRRDARGKIGVQLNQTQITFRSDWEFSTY